MNVFRDLGHVAAVSGLVKDDIDLIQRSSDRFTVADVAVSEFDLGIDPSRFTATMRLRLKIIQDANFPALAHQQIGNV